MQINIMQCSTNGQKNHMQWIKIAKPKYVHPVQMDTLTDGMKQFIVQSFYKKTGT